ncbi:hypothetical protein [Flavobacterium gyeonganense]|uniref:YD repeat-containing protein n=1 Tax=Flavobacterium gyeonganense TaxID=1310418 RepID=A0ABV5HDS4_9FLAO|nr:hypothetical protein [Flavobacterium gyeonganense]
MIAFGTVSGGAGAALTGGNFWQGAVTGLVVSGLNHAAHSDDNGYDKNGNQVNNNGGDTTDYMYDDNGEIISSTSVTYRGVSQGEFGSNGGKLRGYGFKGFKLSTGAIAEDNTIFEMYAGGKVLGAGWSYLGEGLNTLKTPFFRATGNFIREYVPKLGANRYLRIGTSTSRGREVFRITWGNNSKHLLDIDLGKIPKIKKL